MRPSGTPRCAGRASRGRSASTRPRDSVVRIFIAVYQGLLLQTVLDDTLDHDRLAATAEHILRAALAGPDTLRPA
ncbi:hypothetical protein [Dactylosporangium sp. NPDC005555]|uniref:hypothetical protein n=1 Tax=Dactylosporangium sp. NPDC005555 TaxID=3154889 RepID=UPI0033B9E62B